MVSSMSRNTLRTCKWKRMCVCVKDTINKNHIFPLITMTRIFQPYFSSYSLYYSIGSIWERWWCLSLSLTHTLICPHADQSSPCLCAFLSDNGSGAKISSVTQLPLCPAKICFGLLADFSFVCFCDMTGKSWTRWELLWWRRGDWRRRKKEIPEGDTESPPPPHFYFFEGCLFEESWETRNAIKTMLTGTECLSAEFL